MPPIGLRYSTCLFMWLHQSRFHQRAIVDRFEAFFHPEMRAQFMNRRSESMRDLETWLPWQQLDFCPPHRADEYALLFWTSEAHAAAEPEEPRTFHNGTRLFKNLPVKRLFPRLITL